MAEVLSPAYPRGGLNLNHRPIYVGFVVGKIALGQDFLLVLPLCHVSSTNAPYKLFHPSSKLHNLMN